MARNAPAPMSVNVARQRIANASFTGPAGQLGAGDRGAFGYMPQYTGNPYDSNDYVYRWRQYVHLYETSWEARKIVRIIPEDALRKEWLAEDIPEDKARLIKTRLDRLQFLSILKRSLMLERLLGGCLTFLGVDSDEDEPSKPFHPKEGRALRFCNAIPISRISRMSWDTNPLSEHYMRPYKYLINGEELDVSRCLVWDGEPLFDPYDFALTNFRGNLAGFGPSKLAPIWDDVVKAVGTRQAAYQLIQTNNAILVAVQDLQDLTGTKSGREALQKVKAIAQQLSAYNAALIDGDKVDVKQHSASFGSVPELIMTFIQILSAASDIPATRFLGQAPGGLNATGESDLENYYNVIDAYQRQRIEPNLRRVYDIIGYHEWPNEWAKLREKLTFKFPPMWNLSELEEADRSTKVIDNCLKLVEAGLMSDEKALQEINAKNGLSVNLDETDIDLARTAGLGEEEFGGPEGGATPPSGPNGQPGARTGAEGAPGSGNAKQEIQRLRNMAYIKGVDKLSLLVKAAGCDPAEFDMGQVQKGYLVEQEHRDVTHGEPVEIMKIVMAHLAEVPDYYDKLERVENISGSVVGAIKRASGTKKDKLYLDLSFGEREELLEKVILGLPSGGRRLSSLRSEVGRIAGTFAETDVTERFLRGMSVKYPKKILANFTLGLDEVVLNSIPLDRLPKPTPSQVRAGNYKKHHLKLHGLDVAIENPRFSERHGVDKDGTPWSSILPAHYGYVKRTEGADGDHVDIYIGPHEESDQVFVVDQLDADTGNFDEHKCIFGALGLTQARELYLAGFSDGKAEKRLGKITPASVDEFKQWLKEGDTKAPFAKGE